MCVFFCIINANTNDSRAIKAQTEFRTSKTNGKYEDKVKKMKVSWIKKWKLVESITFQ